jgi:hypothetical protein
MLRRLHVSLAVLAAFGTPDVAYAGMPSVSLSDVARLRLQTISFFLVIFLIAGKVIQVLWNRLGHDWTVLPRLNYRGALGLVFLWGLLFVVVLTMISGARELLTPGAWEKDGVTYKLANGSPAAAAPDDRERRDWERERKLDRLRIALWKYAAAHEGSFPASHSSSEIASGVWQTPDASGMAYVYIAGRKADRGAALLAFEPDVFGDYQLVLLTNGEIRRTTAEQLDAALTAEQNP